MAATRFEFEPRFWIIGFIFWIGFALSAVDHTNVAVAIARRSTDGQPGAGAETWVVRSVIIAGAALVFVAAFLRTWASAYLRTEVCTISVSTPRRCSPTARIGTSGTRY